MKVPRRELYRTYDKQEKYVKHQQRTNFPKDINKPLQGLSKKKVHQSSNHNEEDFDKVLDTIVHTLNNKQLIR
jgi:hypothetical protein